MSHSSPLGHRLVAGSALSIMCLLSVGLAASQNPLAKWFGGDKNTSYQTFKDPSGRFEIDYPAKDWKPLPSGGSSLAVFSGKDGPTLFVDHLRLEEPLTPDEIGAMPEVEVARLREQQPKVKDFKADRVDSKAGRGVIIQYSRIGTVPESVMQLSILVGPQDLYRLNGIVPDKVLPKYGSMILHMIQSFKAQPDPSAAKN